MTFPILIASVRELLPLVFLGIPSAICGLAFLTAAGILAARKSKEDMKGVLLYSVIGVILICFLFASPRLQPLVNWMLGYKG